MTDELTPEERQQAVARLAAVLNGTAAWRALALHSLSLCESMQGPTEWTCDVARCRAAALKLDGEAQA